MRNAFFGNTFFDNDNDALIPEMWANEGLAILEDTMVLGNLVYRDYSNELAQFGDVVNVHKPRTFTAKRKVDADQVTVQDAISDNIPVPLNQHAHTSFLIKDGEESLSFKDLVNLYLRPGVISLSTFVDKVLSSQAVRFPTVAGGLGQLTGSNAASFLLEARQALNVNKIPQDANRNCVLTPYSETAMLENTNFTSATFVGDEGTALREASLGRKFGLNILMAQNQPYISSGNTVVTGAINHAAGYLSGTKTFVVDGLAAAITAGTWITIAGDNTPLQVVSTVGAGTPTSITTYQGIVTPVVENAVITLYAPGAVNNASGYAVNYAKEITIDGLTVAPQVGQPVTFGSDNANVYSIIDTNGLVGITLDRPLAAALVENQTVNLGPAGSYNFVFHRDALALVSRPLSLPRSGMGAMASNITYNNLSMRVVMSYQGRDQGTLVTLDMLLGVALLETKAGVLFCG